LCKCNQLFPRITTAEEEEPEPGSKDNPLSAAEFFARYGRLPNQPDQAPAPAAPNLPELLQELQSRINAYQSWWEADRAISAAVLQAEIDRDAALHDPLKPAEERASILAERESRLVILRADLVVHASLGHELKEALFTPIYNLRRNLFEALGCAIRRTSREPDRGLVGGIGRPRKSGAQRRISEKAPFYAGTCKKSGCR
jgi:hypothetical protein